MAHFNTFENDELDSEWQLKVVGTLTFEETKYIAQGGRIDSEWLKHVFSGWRYKVIILGERVGEGHDDKNRIILGPSGEQLVKIYRH